MVDKLEACPFCRESVFGWSRPDGDVTVTCRACGAKGPIEDSDHDAITGWNTRGPTPTQDTRERVKVLEEARPFSEWSEDHGDVLWWKLPIMESPYCGSPLDLGRGMKVTVQIGFEEHEMPITHTGGWPFDQEDEPDLWWSPLPSPTFARTALGNKETDRG